MKTIDLKGTKRSVLGKKESKKNRSEELVPCVIYGNNQENLHFNVSERDLSRIIFTPHAYLVKLDIEGKLLTGVLRDIQFHPVTDKVIHVDFFSVVEDKPVSVDLPVVVSGNSIGVKQGGKLQVLARRLKVQALPAHLPEDLPVDVTDLDLGKTIFVRDLSYENITILSPASSTICRVKATRASREAGAEANEGKKK